MDHTGSPEARSFPWSCSGDKVPFHYASGLPKTGVEIRRSQVVQGTRMEASEGYACTLERIGREHHQTRDSSFIKTLHVLQHMVT